MIGEQTVPLSQLLALGSDLCDIDLKCDKIKEVPRER